MDTALKFQETALTFFRRRIASWIGYSADRPVVINDVSEIEKILADFSGIGEYTIVDFTEAAHFDNFSAVRRKGENLYVAWYEDQDRFQEGRHSHYLKFKPKSLVFYPDQDLAMNHLVVETDELNPLPKSEYITEPDEYGMQTLMDVKGEELRNLSSNERYHLFLVMCRPGRIVLHPKGSELVDRLRGVYHRKQ